MSICRTFQEGLLSERLLVFTDYQMFFHCLAGSWMEGLGNPDPTAASPTLWGRYSVQFFENVLAETTLPLWDLNDLATVVEAYSERQISNEADTLDAFLGVTNHIRRARPGALILCGLPILKTSGEASGFSLIDLFDGHVTFALSWDSDEEESGPLQRRAMFPSWTWAGWRGKVQFWSRQICHAEYQCFLRQAQLYSSSGQMVVSPALWESGNNDKIQQELDMVTQIQFKAPMVPADSFSFTEHPLVDEESDDSSANIFKLRVAGRLVRLFDRPGLYTCDILIENVRKSIWSCFMLCAEGWNQEFDDDDDLYSRFVLVVRLKEDQSTAERIGAFSIYSNPNEDARLGSLGEENWEWCRIRLI
jgi:hypothetical protein